MPKIDRPVVLKLRLSRDEISTYSDIAKELGYKGLGPWIRDNLNAMIGLDISDANAKDMIAPDVSDAKEE